MREETVYNPYQYTGRQYDAESGLYHYRARAYSPDIGRFLQQDPAGMVAESFTRSLDSTQPKITQLN